MEVVHEEYTLCVLKLRNCDLAFTSAWRRAMYAVPTVAITVADIESNKSVMNDHQLGHRLGLVTLDNSGVRPWEMADVSRDPAGPCESCAPDQTSFCKRCAIPFTLSVQCDGSSGNRIVTTKDLVCDADGGATRAAVAPVCAPTSTPTTIVTLNKGDTLNLRCYARLASSHARHSAVVRAFFGYDEDLPSFALPTCFDVEVETTGSVSARALLVQALSMVRVSMPGDTSMNVFDVDQLAAQLPQASLGPIIQ